MTLLRAWRGSTLFLLLLLVSMSVQAAAAERAASAQSSSSQSATESADSNVDPARREAEEASDPDRPPMARGKIHPAEYLKLRDQHIMRLRGLGNPNRRPDPSSRSRAIRSLQQQERQLRQNLQAAPPLAGGISPFLSATTWTELGPAPIPNGQTSPSVPVSGRVTAVAVHPTNPDIAYVGTAQGGLYRTLDGGANWIQLWDSELSLAIGAVTIHPQNSSIVFVGTGESNVSLDSFFGVGLYRIENADTTPVISGPFETRVTGTGTTASNGHAFLGTSISSIAVDPTNPNRIFVGNIFGRAGLSGTVICCGLNPNSAFVGLYFSSNALSANPVFSRVSGVPGNGAGAVTDIVFEPGSGTNMLVGVRDVFTNGTIGGIYRTTNANVGSASMSPGFVLVKDLGGQFVDVRLAINNVSSVVTAVAATGESNGRLYKSTDGGATWPTILTAANGFCGDQCLYDLAIAMHPSDPNVIYIGGQVESPFVPPGASILKKTVNGGITFSAQTSSLHADTHAIAIAPSNANVVYTGNDGGIFRTTNASAASIAWNSLNTAGFNATQFQSLALHPTDREFLLGGTQDNGTQWKKPDGSWTRADFGDGGFALIDQNAANTTNVTMYHTYFNQTNNIIGFARITNTGNATDGQWNFFGCGGTPNGINCSDNVLFYAPMALGPGSPNRVYFGTDKLYRSDNQGDTMTPMSQVVDINSAISAIGISPQNDNVRIVGTSSGRVFATITGSNPLSELTPSSINWPFGYVGRAVIDPNNSNTAYVTVSSLGDPDGMHVWKTTNLAGGAGTWAPSGNGIPDVPVNAFAIDPQNSNVVFAGTDIGVFRSTDGGANWSGFGLGLPRVAVFDMAIQNTNRVLRVATHGRGIWEIALAPPEDFTLAISNPSQTVFVGQTVPFNGTLTAINGYNDSVTISCVPSHTGVPDTCTGATATPSPGGQAFSVTAGNSAAGSFAFNMEGVGSDPDSITRSQAVTLNVVGVTLGTIGTINVVRGNTSSDITFDAVAAGPYNGTITLSCSGLPAGATCNFISGNTIAPRLGSPVTVTFRVVTLGSTPVGNATVTIVGTSASPTGTTTREFSLNVTAPTATSDLGVAVTASPGIAQFGAAVPFSVLVSNAGPDTANNINVTITFSGARLKTLPGSCMAVGSVLTCTIGQVTNGGNTVLQPVFEARITGAIAVSATVNSDSSDGNASNNLNTASKKIRARVFALRGVNTE
ncbi:MAG: DUF11 domain-containing protein [Acidobacteriales bacterium]|nr:DUF11 domain-containing protein [Terriglobales bacterium]